MALKVFVKLQTPTIELKVEAKDASGNKDSILVGFKRYEVKQTEEKLKNLQTVLENADSDISKLEEVIKNEVVYIKNAKVILVDDEKGTEKETHVQDTRTAKPVETLWGDPDECLAVLLDLYLASAPYRVSFMTSMQRALINNDFDSAEAKNS